MDTTPEKMGSPGPIPANAFQPWDWVGEPRRDCEPHRAPLLRVLAWVSLAAAGLSLPCLFPGLIALPLGLAVWIMACRDLKLISAGDVDSRGFHGTERARFHSHAAVLLALFGFLLWSPVVLVVLSVIFSPMAL
jgi:hypothetical protein